MISYIIHTDHNGDKMQHLIDTDHTGDEVAPSLILTIKMIRCSNDTDHMLVIRCSIDTDHTSDELHHLY